MIWKKLTGFALASGLAASSLGLLSLPQRAIAAEQIVLKYNIFRRSVAVADLTTFAETGETNRAIRRYIRMSRQNPEDVRRTLSDKVEVDVVVLNRVLNSPAGDLLLEQLSNYIYTSSRKADKEAMRAALTLSASEDNNISIIEIAQNYPTEKIYIDGNRLSEAYAQIALLRGGVENILEQIRGLL